MKALIEAMQDDTEQRRQAAVETYRRLLHRGDSPDFSPADMARFKEAAELLGKSIGDVTADFRTVEEARRWKALADTIDLEHKTATETTAAVEAHAEEMGRQREEMNRRHNQLNLAAFEAAGRLNNARDARSRLGEMRKQHAAILVGIECVEAECEKATPLTRGGPFEVVARHPQPNGQHYGVWFKDGRGTTDVVEWAKCCADHGFIVRDLSAPQPPPETAGTYDVAAPPPAVNVTTDLAAPAAADAARPAAPPADPLADTAAIEAREARRRRARA